MRPLMFALGMAGALALAGLESSVSAQTYYNPPAYTGGLHPGWAPVAPEPSAGFRRGYQPGRPRRRVAPGAAAVGSCQSGQARLVGHAAIE
jgi:hypothetical protein